MSRKRLKLEKGERIVTAFAEPAAGPGWGNTPIWVVIYSSMTGDYRQECIQPNEQTAEMHYLYSMAAAAHLAMVRAVERSMKT